MTNFTRLAGMGLCALALVGCAKAKMDLDTSVDTQKALAAKLQDVRGLGTEGNDQALRGVDQVVGGDGTDKVQLMGKSCNRSKSGTGADATESQLTLNGGECPIDFQVKQTLSDRHPRYSLHYSAKTDEAKKARDLENLDSTSETNRSDDGVKVDHQESIEALITSKGKLTYHESVHTQENEHGLVGDLVVTVETPDKAAELKVTRSLDGDNNIKEDILFNGDKPADDVSKRIHDLTIDLWSQEQH